jgi:GNAT superfamily N-acetyltransferase
MDIQVRGDLRRQGVGKYLIARLLRYLREQYFGIAEVQAATTKRPSEVVRAQLRTGRYGHHMKR